MNGPDKYKVKWSAKFKKDYRLAIFLLSTFIQGKPMEIAMRSWSNLFQ